MTIDFSYSLDGRLATKTYAAALQSPRPTLTMTNSEGYGSVYRAVNIAAGSATYEYWYDAFNRRVAKVSPTQERQELTWLFGTNTLLQDEGGWAGGYDRQVDEYVWLGGRPVAVRRSLVKGSDYSRMVVEPSDDCARLGSEQTGRCGWHFIVTDYLGKPVWVEGPEQNATGVGNYDPFGRVNHRPAWAEVTPVNASTPTYSWMHWDSRTPAGWTRLQRYKLDRLDLEQCQYGTDTLYVVDEYYWPQWSVSGQAGGQWTPWRRASGAVLVANGTNFEPGSCGTMGSNVVYQGVSIPAVQYQLIEGAATDRAFFPPLRFPGQYEDAETEMFENWNRYYDPSVGRYLSPEPLLQSPEYLADLAQSGYSGAAYGYALHNPLRFSDQDGRIPILLVWGIAAGVGFAVGYFAGINPPKFHVERNRLNRTTSYAEAVESWRQLTDFQSRLHRFGPGNENHEKFVSMDGHHEAVFSRYGDLVTDSLNGGTYNYYGPEDGIRHGVADVAPYWLWGNGPDDPSNVIQRSFGVDGRSLRGQRTIGPGSEALCR